MDITVEDKRIKFDYSSTDAQSNGFVNGTFTSSASATILTLLQMINPDIPHNEGMVEPIEIVIPEGTILNASYPKATTFGNHLCPPNADAIQRALAPVMPERVTAGWNNLLCSLTTGIDPQKNEKYVDIGFMGLKGGSGAMRGTDGYDHIGMIDASGGVLDQDYEMFEQQTPHRLIKHEYLRDSAGAGEWRGGLGVETIFEIGSDNTQLVTFGDGDFEPAFGLFGGGSGTLNFIRLTYPDGKVVVPRNKDLITDVPKGTDLPPAGRRRRRLWRSAQARSHANCAKRCATGWFRPAAAQKITMDFELSPRATRDQSDVRALLRRARSRRRRRPSTPRMRFRARCLANWPRSACSACAIPKTDGGSGLALVEFCLALEEIARGSLSVAGCVAMQSLMGTKFLHMLGNADIRRTPVQAGAARRKDRRDLHDRAQRRQRS